MYIRGNAHHEYYFSTIPVKPLLTLKEVIIIKRKAPIYPVPDAPLHRIKKYPGYFIDDNNVIWSTHGRLYSIRPLKRSFYKRIPKYTLSLNGQRVNVPEQRLKPYKKSKNNIARWPQDDCTMIAPYQLGQNVSVDNLSQQVDNDGLFDPEVA